jgi:hypothetical protein
MENNKSVSSEFELDMPESYYLKGIEFDSEGLELEVVRMEKFTPEDSKYGVKNTYGAGGVVEKEHWFIKNGILKEGESFRYVFIHNGTEKSFDNASLGFYFSFVKAELLAGDKVLIKRDKKSETKVDWDITKI